MAYAFGRTGSAADSFVDCLTTHLSNISVDLFLLEFAINGASSTGTSAAPLEALVRRLLSLPSSPALLAINFFPWLVRSRGDTHHASGHWQAWGRGRSVVGLHGIWRPVVDGRGRWNWLMGSRKETGKAP